MTCKFVALTSWVRWQLCCCFAWLIWSLHKFAETSEMWKSKFDWYFFVRLLFWWSTFPMPPAKHLNAIIGTYLSFSVFLPLLSFVFHVFSIEFGIACKFVWSVLFRFVEYLYLNSRWLLVRFAYVQHEETGNSFELCWIIGATQKYRTVVVWTSKF